MQSSAPFLQQILFIDLETVPQYPTYGQLPEEWQQLWSKKAEALLKSREEETTESIYTRAGIYAEFGKIVCISCGLLQGYGNEKKLVVKSFYNDNEKALLQEFLEMLQKWSEPQKYLCAHNGKEFDYPYLCRRLVIQGMELPDLLQIAGKKPWDIPHLDTMELWKFGDFKSYTSLHLLANALGIPTPKDDIDGSQVGDVYWHEKNLQRIATYCQKDVLTTVQIYLRMKGEALVLPENVIYR
jgi:hypothetical protein